MNRGILSILGVAVFFAILFGSAVLSPQAFAGVDPPTPNNAGKVTICHNGDDGPETITVSGNAVDKHLDKHGDHVGACFVCGDGFTDSPDETCDDGASNGNPGFCNNSCDGTVPAASCGDGNVDAGEACDEGDANGDSTCGCNDSCQYPDTNVVCRVGSGDACDLDEFCDGAGLCPTDTVGDAGTLCRVGSGDICDPNEFCTGVSGQACPDNVVASAGTVCREGSSGDICDPAEICTGAAGQACPANLVAEDGIACGIDGMCSVGICEEPVCGDGIHDASEACDDGNVANDDGCSSTCQVEAFCGDGIVNQASEQCDDGSRGCVSCQLPTGSGTTLVHTCQCINSVFAHPNVCIDAPTCTLANTQDICADACLSATGDATVVGGSCDPAYLTCPGN